MNEHETKTDRELAWETLVLAMEHVEGLVKKGRQQYFDRVGIDPLPITQPDEELGDVLAPTATFWTRLFDSGRAKEECDEIIVHEAYVSGLRDVQEAQKREVADFKKHASPEFQSCLSDVAGILQTLQQRGFKL
jgi:hypothetical protein